jgi:hypothetical protein
VVEMLVAQVWREPVAYATSKSKEYLKALLNSAGAFGREGARVG